MPAKGAMFLGVEDVGVFRFLVVPKRPLARDHGLFFES
jgi:hypothetical protein